MCLELNLSQRYYEEKNDFTKTPSMFICFQQIYQVIRSCNQIGQCLEFLTFLLKFPL